MSTPHTDISSDAGSSTGADGAASSVGDSAFQAALIAFIAGSVALADDPIDADTDLLLTGLVDSLGVVMIVGWMEAELDVAIDPADVVLDNFQTVGQMVAYAATLAPAAHADPPTATA